MDKTLIAVGLILMLYGCATSPIPLGLPCNVGPIIGDHGASSRWTRAEQEQIATLNQAGEKLCRWSAPAK